MYEKLDFNIENYAYDDIETMYAWENVMRDTTTEILEAFGDEDWEQLYEELPGKPAIWKLRFYDCLPDVAEDARQVKALLLLADTDDPELFARSLAKLENFDFGNLEDLAELQENAERLLPEIKDSYHRYVISNFLTRR